MPKLRAARFHPEYHDGDDEIDDDRDRRIRGQPGVGAGGEAGRDHDNSALGGCCPTADPRRQRSLHRTGQSTRAIDRPMMNVFGMMGDATGCCAAWGQVDR